MLRVRRPALPACPVARVRVRRAACGGNVIVPAAPARAVLHATVRRRPCEVVLWPYDDVGIGNRIVEEARVQVLCLLMPSQFPSRCGEANNDRPS